MNKTRNRVAFGTAVVGTAVLLFFAGCKEEQLQQVDKVVTDINDLKTIIQEVIEGPVGEAIPFPAKQIIGGALGLSALIGQSYFGWRYRTMKKTTRAIVRGIEKAEQSKRNSSVKTNIRDQMVKARVFDQGNKLVDKFKGAL